MFDPVYSHYKDQINIIKFYTTLFTSSLFGIIISTFIHKDLPHLSTLSFILLYLYFCSIMILVVIGKIVWQKTNDSIFALQTKENTLVWLQNEIVSQSKARDQASLELLRDNTNSSPQMEEPRKVLAEYLKTINIEIKEYKDALNKQINIKIVDHTGQYIGLFQNLINLSVFFLILSVLSILM